ncbi:MSMEG_0570 family nitrogen starvation response protein [Candidatus Methylospira mobilis]|uniref:MSMEG_0570 family nitrogen starvation response protein n=1 Tax=Candidatus Methylospira mobilis TaxID=1808979 RepID=A0A5Q0BGG0_9GAMM|nr:MSMEG_0570 family nitrogen starvation response protein [Candidatus Methylospira mobilis]QFY42222.1 MSMEG_0570 family nitrogen starvation response protein [Candidatus Methylospira mobilis]WNV03239.1 MSMEG_0570 family nitrogen starvation response protein [Candidatus Methylospira mobilis]
MPEMRFRVRWPDQSETLCYSPSLIIKDYFNPGDSYELADFLTRSREALNIASERVRRKFGFTCSSAMNQLEEIETIAARFSDTANAQIVLEEFIE